MFNERKATNNDKRHLFEEDFFGTSVRECYERGIELFGWRDGLITYYGRQPRIYYAPAIDAKTGIWFITYSNLNEKNTRDPNGNFKNIFSDGYEAIEEIYENIDRAAEFSVGQIRVTFAKNDYNQYLFVGVYRIETIEGQSIKYRRISNRYPY